MLAQGGVLPTGKRAWNTHKAAWLVSAAVAGFIDLDRPDANRSKEIEVRRLAPGDPAARPVLDTAFRGRDRVRASDRYDEDFAAAWKAIGAELSAWAAWQRPVGRGRRPADPRYAGSSAHSSAFVWGGSRRRAVRRRPRATASSRSPWSSSEACWPASASRRASAGVELQVLTPEGASAWLQVESLRQFLATSPSATVDAPIDTDRLGEYTAWAVALGQAARLWSRIANRVSAVSGSSYDAHHLRYVCTRPVFASSCASASTAPSSSSGGGGGGVGGGSGGGGRRLVVSDQTSTRNRTVTTSPISTASARRTASFTGTT